MVTDAKGNAYNGLFAPPHLVGTASLINLGIPISLRLTAIRTSEWRWVVATGERSLGRRATPRVVSRSVART